MQDNLSIVTDDCGVLAKTDSHMHAANVAVNINIDIAQIAYMIWQAIKSDRGAFVKSLLDRLASETNGEANIMIFNRSSDCEFNPDWTTTKYQEVNYEGTLYGIWIFCGGHTFKNLRDGGWINWGFYGVFDRDGNTVYFKSRSFCRKS